jgi:hypothetical protein
MRFAILVAATGLFSFGVVTENEASVTTSQSVTVELTCGALVALGSRSLAILDEGAQALLQSSESNSQLAGWHFPVSEVQEEFRGAIASDHLRVTFATVRTIESAGVRMVTIWRAVRDATGRMDECKLPKNVPGFS